MLRSAGLNSDKELMRYLIGIVFIFFAFLASAQTEKKNSEIGFGLGIMTYTGDLTQSIKPRYFRPGATGYYRLNISNATSFRASITAGRITAADEKAPIDSFAVVRSHDFGIYVAELSGVIEYHFLKWKENPMQRWTPYVFGGIGLFTVMGSDVEKEYSSIQPAVPFGVGAKYVLNPRHMLEFQFGLRKTFFDNLDNVSEGDLTKRDFQYGNWYDTDMYYFFGISFTISYYDIPCPKFPY